jgi:glutaredoxin
MLPGEVPTYAWPECPYCAAEMPTLDALELRGHAWVLTSCQGCGRPFEVRMTELAQFSMRQRAERRSPARPSEDAVAPHRLSKPDRRNS